ncbi:DNA polymerase delta, subunit 4-domain-containing protein [Immersiella caudata]|uniref:DNA polymerase delta, subunit 4-domain-containing protein n=1 Tax=Immersiella caudata TaxID=314043 RepID=A0AA39WFB7_9PEZI|nr:DNA polymerase delta, subunit 4-domain-containing protein [Immersiella caudata]
MPATRKSSRLSSGVGSKQSTLSFNHKVTKSVPKSAKEAALDKPSPLAKEIVPEPETKDEKAVEEVPTEIELKAEKVSAKEIERYWSKIDSTRKAKAAHKKHGEGLSTGEKVLRYFDVSSHYGPCIGTSRMKRWQRAQRLGLNPPIEVLAVLLKEEASGDKNIEQAHMDELMNSTAAGA